MAANGLINKEKLRKTHLCFGNNFPRKISSYWRDYGPDTRIPCPLPSIGHRPQTPVEARYIRYIKFYFFFGLKYCAHIQVKTLKVTLSCAFYIVHVYIHVPSTLFFNHVLIGSVASLVLCYILISAVFLKVMSIF